MRILMLAQFYRPISGGEERYVHDLSHELVARGYDVAVATLWQEGTATFENDGGVRIYRMQGLMQRVDVAFRDKKLRHAPPFPDIGVMRELRRIIERERPDVVHAHNWLVHSFTPLKRWSRAKLVVTLHDCSLVCATQRFEYEGALCSGPGMAKCLTCAGRHYGFARGIPISVANGIWGKREQSVVDMFLPVSRAVAEATQLSQHRLSYRVIPNFVADNLEEASDETHPLLGQLPERDFLLFVGAMGRGKGEDVLLRAYAGMRSIVPLVLIGQLPEGFSQRLSPNVFTLQSWPRAAVMGAWKRCAIAVIPSRSFDSCPTVALEAMTMGRPIVASRIGGLPELVVDSENGVLVPPGDAEALREAIEQMLAQPERREQMGMRARQRAGAFRASVIVPRIEQVYAEVLQGVWQDRREPVSI